MIVIVLILLLLSFPDLCFFLNAPQKEALKLFNKTYLGNYMPMRTEEGGFDFMRLVALILMIAGCWAVYRIIMWIFSLIKTKTRREEFSDSLVIYGLRIEGALTRLKKFANSSATLSLRCTMQLQQKQFVFSTAAP